MSGSLIFGVEGALGALQADWESLETPIGAQERECTPGAWQADPGLHRFAAWPCFESHRLVPILIWFNSQPALPRESQGR